MTVTITTLLLPLGIDQLSLNSFRDSAKTGDALQVVHDGSTWKVVACTTTMAQRLGPGADFEIDTTTVFVHVLGQAFSRGIQDAVVRELALLPKPGQPLESHLVLQAIAMAQASRKALQGVDFMTQLMLSATAQGAEFVAACEALGLAPEALGAAQRAALDGCMKERFEQALQHGQSPVEPALARQWLQAELLVISAPTPDAL